MTVLPWRACCLACHTQSCRGGLFLKTRCTHPRNGLIRDSCLAWDTRGAALRASSFRATFRLCGLWSPGRFLSVIRSRRFVSWRVWRYSRACIDIRLSAVLAKMLASAPPRNACAVPKRPDRRAETGGGGERWCVQKASRQAGLPG